jgi:hypothetical protein
MNRWLQSFVSFCDLTASGFSDICTSSNNSQAGTKGFKTRKSPQPKAGFSRTLSMQAARHANSESDYTQHLQPAYSFASAGFVDNTEQSCNSKLLLSPRERMPLAVNVHSFKFPLLSKDDYAVTVDHGANSACCAGVSDDLDRNVGGGGGDGELAIHRAARQGTVELLRFILRCCKRGTAASHTPPTYLLAHRECDGLTTSTRGYSPCFSSVCSRSAALPRSHHCRPATR